MVSQTDGSKTMMTTQSGLFGAHVYNSGAVVINAHSQSNPLNFSESQAQQFASTYISDSLGMPSDAVLASTAAIMRGDMNSNTYENIGYVVTYLHASGTVVGGDAIHVVVDDAVTYTQGACISWDWSSPDPPQKPVRYCAQYSEIPHDNLNVSHMYFLWRTFGQQMFITSSGRSTGQQSIDAVTASRALPNPSSVTWYGAGYWTPGSNENNSNGARPAWLFLVGGATMVAVDGFSGQVLGTNTLSI